MYSAIQTIFKSKLLPTSLSVFQRIPFATEAELLDLFQSREPVYHRELVLTKEKRITRKEQVKPEKKKEVVIKCLRSELDHYKNQKYDKFKPIPLASKGWHHNKSIGDHFTVQIYNKDYDINHHFWDESVNSFSELKLDDVLVCALKEAGFNRPTKIQADSIPVILSGKNAIIAAETGCGKTLAYLIPVLQQILHWKKLSTSERKANTPLAVIITPSRELATQIGNVAKGLSYHLPLTCDELIGGRTKHKMLFPNFKNVDLLVATLGAVSKMTTTGIYNMKEAKHLILDESDTLLDDSFNDHLLRYIKNFQIRYSSGHRNNPVGCQLVLASATFPNNIDNLLTDIVETASVEKITSKHLHRFLPHVPQTFFRMRPTEKPQKLIQLARKAVANKEPTIIFSNRSPSCDWISLMLNENGVPTVNLNGEMPVMVRKGKFKQFCNEEYFILSCTDIASRGLDTKNVKHIINYDFPLYMADYVHRCGRTGRCGSAHDCKVTNFVSGGREVELVNKIEMAVRTMDVLPGVNGNITKIIQNQLIKKQKNQA